MSSTGQLITGYWKGKIDRKNVEVKIIKNGDSITGTSYYYESSASYRRFSIRGYFDSRDNSAVWWDDQLIEEKNSRRLLTPKSELQYFSSADFNCPGGTKMYLNGNASLKNNINQKKGIVDLEKITIPLFKDEWDFIIDNYTVGANDRDLIDSISQLAFAKTPVIHPPPILPTKPEPVREKEQVPSVLINPIPTIQTVLKPLPEQNKELSIRIIPQTNLQKFSSRSKQVIQEIAISGDSIELRFYDNAEVDGDSIAIFLNGQLLYEHVLLTEKPYILKMAVAALQETNELVMVAENLGAIPPNTALMVAIINGKRYETRLVSTEQSSALIRFIHQQKITEEISQ